MKPGEYCYLITFSFTSFGKTTFLTCKGTVDVVENETRLEIINRLVDCLVQQIIANPYSCVDEYAAENPGIQFISIEPN